MQGFSEFGRSLSWKNEALLLFLWPQDNPLCRPPSLKRAHFCSLLLLTSSRSCLTSSTSSSSTSVRNSPVWSMELMKSCSRRCLLLTLLLHLSVRGQKQSEQICRPAEIQRPTRLLHLSHADLWHTLTSHTNTGQNSFQICYRTKVYTAWMTKKLLIIIERPTGCGLVS